MKRKNHIFIQLFFCSFLSAQIPNIIPTSVSIANTSVADIYSRAAFSNPAMLAYVEFVDFSAGFENRYFLKELSTKSVQAGFSTQYINVGAAFSYFGYSLYHEMLAGIDFARNFSDKFALGIGFDYYAAYFSAANEYHGALLGRVGIAIRLSNNFTLGFSAFNLFQNNIRTDFVTKRLPAVFSIGTSYAFSSDFVWRTQIDKEISSNYRFATGFEYRILDLITVKLGGYAFRYFVPCLGLGFGLGDYSAGLNCELNPLLGVTTQFTLKCNLRR